MRLTSFVIASALVAATPVLAQSPSGNVSQPERAVPQAGSTTRGPIDNPSTRGMAPNPDAAPVAPGAAGMGAGDSAKGGNADQNNRTVPNTGNTSGGPAR
ncbi:hypothetical protein [Methylobacterium sp. Leaf108]|uniref:hypothetical protein n=1 Tax=Methylobacterium sp. Leaf108 TaxID=1736256 RepID=UPI0006FFBF49|nr:hypothetical protein [Methylobacterium sp. Leaf108]KQP54986.1 hypothetical protein ASF39_04390 [Methylobacterium sp. Leaf108]